MFRTYRGMQLLGGRPGAGGGALRRLLLARRRSGPRFLISGGLAGVAGRVRGGRPHGAAHPARLAAATASPPSSWPSWGGSTRWARARRAASSPPSPSAASWPSRGSACPSALTGVFQGVLLLSLLGLRHPHPVPPAAGGAAMNELALLVAATLAAGTPLALAGLGLLVNERAGVVNLGAEGMMAIAAVTGFAVAFHTGSDWVGFAAGAAAAAAVAVRLRLARPLALHEPVRHRARGLPLRRRLLGVRGHRATWGKNARAQRDRRHPRAARPALPRPGPLPPAPDGLPGHRAHGGHRLVLLPDPGRARAPLGRRVAGVGPRARLPGAPDPPGRRRSPAARSAASPAPTSPSSTRRCGSRG